MTVWFYDPLELFNTHKLLNFWPTSSQSPDERVNASTRFILYTATLIYLLKRDIRVFILALMVVSVIFILYKSNTISQSDKPYPIVSQSSLQDPSCQLPTQENPMANVLLDDYENDPTRPPACFYPTVKPQVQRYLDNTIPYDASRSRSSLPKYQRQFGARQFVSAPVTTIPNNQTDFAEWCYGKKNRPMCKDDPSVCNPNARGVQLSSFAGIDPSGNQRTGMRGYSGGKGNAS